MAWEKVNWGKSPVISLYCSYKRLYQQRKVLVKKSYDGSRSAVSQQQNHCTHSRKMRQQIPLKQKQEQTQDNAATSLTSLTNSMGRFIIFSVITNIYNTKTKRPTLMEFFTATGNLKKFFLTTRDVRCVHQGWHGTHRYDIQVLATHVSTCVLRYSSLKFQ
jgi:hypothetical protein